MSDDAVSGKNEAQRDLCPLCAGALAWDPVQQVLTCAACGTSIPPDASDAPDTGADGTEGLGLPVATFPRGAVIDTAKRSSGFLAERIVPFATTERQARDAMCALIDSAWLVPVKLTRLARSGAINAFYLPFWSFEAHSVAHWDRPGMRGILEMDFRDVFVCAARGFETRLLDALQPYPARSAQDYDASRLQGRVVAEAQGSLPEAALRARVRAEREMLVTARRSQRKRDREKVQLRGVEYTRETFQPVLLPVWTLDYTYLSRRYRIAVNGATGKAAGRVPMSVLKAALVAIAALCLYLLVEGPRFAPGLPGWFGEAVPDVLESAYLGE